MSTLTFSVFADLHHYPHAFRTFASSALQTIKERAVKENSAFVIHCGDFCHVPHESTDILQCYRDFPMPTYHCFGNHDTDGTSFEETLKLYGMPSPYYYFDVKNFRMIVLDTNYFFDGESYVHFSLGNYYKLGKGRGDYIPPEETAFLKNALETAPGKCILFSHASAEREVGAIHNRDEVKALLRDINARFHGRVLMWINGHYHRDHLSILDNIAYLDLNATSYDWIDNPHKLYPQSDYDEYSFVGNTVCYNDPIHAVITVSDDGEVHIDGMESSMYMGINREHTDNPLTDGSGRPVVPRVSSAHFKLY